MRIRCDVVITTAALQLAEMAKCVAYVSGEPMTCDTDRSWQIPLLCGSA